MMDASEQVRKGEALMKRSLFHPFPNYLEAADCFEKAAKQYTRSKDTTAAYAVSVHLLTCYEKLGLDRSALSTIMTLLKIQQSPELIEKGIRYIQLIGDPCMYLQIKELLRYSPSHRISKRILSTFVDDIADIYKVDLYRGYVTDLLKYQKFDELIQIYKLLIPLYSTIDQPHNVKKTILSLLLIEIIRGDIVSAEHEFSNYLDNITFLSSEECEVGEAIIRAVKEGESTTGLMEKYVVLSLDHELVKLLKNRKELGLA